MVRRRKLLRGLGAVVATGVLAGCGGVNDERGTQTQSEDPAEEDGGQQDEPERVAEPAPERVPDRVEFPALSADEPTYRQWIPTSAEFEFGTGVAVNLRRARQRRTEIPPETYEEATGIIAGGEYFGVDYHLLDGLLVIQNLFVYPGEFDRSVIDETLRSTGHEVLESRGEVRFYRNSERDTDFAVGNQGVIERWIGDGKSFADDAMTLFETAAGERTRRHETDTLFQRFTADVGWPLSVSFPQPITDGDAQLPAELKNVIPETVQDSAHLGFAQYGSREKVVERMWVATPGDETGGALIRASFEDATFAEFTEDDEDVAVRHDDGVSEVATVRSHGSGGWGAGPPLVTLSATVEDGQLVLANLAGDRLPLERLTVSAGQKEYQPEGTLAPGDTVRLDVATAEESVAVSYTSPNADSTIRLASVDGDERRPVAGESAETTLVKSVRTY